MFTRRNASVVSMMALAWGLLGASRLAAGDAGDALVASRRLRERAGTIAPLPSSGSGITRDVGAIAIVEHDGSNYDRLEGDGTPNYAARARVAQRFYADHGDRYDFLLVFTNFAFQTNGAIAFHGLVRNDVAGIGMPIVNNGPVFGSPGRLKGYVDMATVEQYRHPPFSDQVGAPEFDDAVDVIAHEIGHQWLAHARFRDGAGVVSQALLGVDLGHWSYLLDSDASLMYGSDWMPESGGIFRATRVQEGYSALDLYLMGLLEASRVPPFTLLRNPTVGAAQLPLEGATVSATPETVAIGQVIAAESPRVPDHLSSQKDFRLGVVFLAAPGVDPSAEDLELADRMREAFASRFFAMTRGVAFIDTTLAEEPLPDPLPAPDVERAVAWLRGRQAPDGRWQDAAGTAVRDTSAALDALREAGAPDQGYARGQAWLADADVPNLDFVSRRARLRAAAATPAERDALTSAVYAHQNTDGGFGAAAGYESDAFDTSLAVVALRELQAPPDARVHRAFAALEALRSPLGGWPLVPGRDPGTLATAQVLLALQAWPDVPEAAALLPAALSALLARQNDDGGFGESPSTAHATALALLALDRLGTPGGVIDDATAWLQGTQAQDGSWNGRTYETALAIKALKGRTAPNLVIRQDGLTLSPTEADEGEIVVVAARVRNDGILPSAPTAIRLYDGAPVAANAVAESAVPSLEPASSIVVTIPFDTAGRPGTRLLTAVADPDHAISEVREDDNAASRSLVVEGPQADLVVAPIDVVVSPYPPETGETVSITISVRNQGAREAPPSQLRVIRGTATVGVASIGPLAPGAVASASVPWTAPVATATVELTVMADAQFAVPESDETNNTAALAVEVTPPGGSGPDLELPLVTVEPPALSTIPQSFYIRAVVRNLGREPLTSTVALFDGDPATGVLVLEQPVVLAARSTTVVSVPFEVVAPGDRTLTAVVDRAGAVEETEEGNNSASVSIDDRGNTTDLAVESANASPASVVVGETVTVTAVLRNRGTTRVTGIPVVLEHATIGELKRTLVTLEPGSVTSVELTWVTSATGIPMPIAVVADPFGLLIELDEANNRRDVALAVQPSSLPNLRVSSADITFEPDPPLQGGSAVLTAVVTNPSPIASGPFVVRFFLGDPGAGGTAVGETSMPGLAAQGSAIASIAWSPVDVYGQQGLWVVADAASVVEEYDETDNIAFRPFQAVSLPDLAISSGELVLEPAFPRVGETSIVRVRVRNHGDRPAAESTLRVFDGEPATGALVGEITLPPLAPGEMVERTLPWSVATAGERLVSALADADEMVSEANEGNNLARRTVIVQDSDTYLTAPYFSPDGDGIQDVTTVVYRTTATAPISVQVSDERGRLVRTLGQGLPAQGQATWDGRDDQGRLLWDGSYTITVRAGSVQGRATVVLDTNRTPVHEAAGTGMVALRAIDTTGSNARGPAWMPSEDEVLVIIPSHQPQIGFPQGLLRWGLDGTRIYVALDDWYDPYVRFASPGAVAPDGSEVLVSKDSSIVAVDLATGARRAIGSGARATWSPDGRRILVERQIFARDGTLEFQFSSGDWQWAPDGERLLSGLSIARRNGDHLADVPLPVELPETQNPGDACFENQTFWRQDDRIAIYIGKIVLEEQGGELQGGLEPRCRGDRVFVFDPATNTSGEAVGLRGVPISFDWSPDGSRLLHPSRTTEAREVTRETGGNSLQIWPAWAVPTPRSTALHACGPTLQICNTGSSGKIWVGSNLLNLTADLAPTPLPGDNGLLLKGTATDANLDRYELDYSTAAAPTTWTTIGPVSQVPVVDGLLGTWVPDSPGTYRVRLRVWDLAGSVRSSIRVVAWNSTPPIANITQSEVIISPNDDPVKQEVRFTYLVQQQVVLDVRIVGPEPPSGGAPAPLQRRVVIPHDALGTFDFRWSGRSDSGALVPDGRYTVYFNAIPFQVDVDVTPPDLGWIHEGSVAIEDLWSQYSPGEQQTPTDCSPTVPVLGIVIATKRHVVDPNLQRWFVGIEGYVNASGTGQLYEPVLDQDGQVVLDSHGVPEILRENGRPVDQQLRLNPSVWYGDLWALDRAGNRSLLPRTPLPNKAYVAGYRRVPSECLPQNAPLPVTRYLRAGETAALPLQTRLYSETALPPATVPHVPALRFEHRPPSGGAWQHSPIAYPHSDLDLVALGLVPGSIYRGRLASADETLQSDEFDFRVCEESVVLNVLPEAIPGVTTHKRYVARLSSSVDAALVATLRVDNKENGFHVQVPMLRVGEFYEAVVVAPQQACDESHPDAENDDVLQFEAKVVRADGVPLPIHDNEGCFDLKRDLFPCEDSLQLLGTGQRCDLSVPGQKSIQVVSRSREPGQPVLLSVGTSGASFVTGDQHCKAPHQVHLYCDDRTVSIDTSALSEGELELRGHMGPSAEQPLARDTMELVVDHTAPAMTMHQPHEGAGLCVERDGLMERALLKFTIADAVESVEMRGVWRRYGDGEWVPLCVGDDCKEAWGEPNTGELIEHYWDVRGIPDGEHTLRFELCDKHGNRSAFERRFTLFRGANAISIEEVLNRDFSPNGDGRADEASASVKLAQALHMTVEVRAGTPNGVVVRTIVDDQTVPAGDRVFVWDGRNDQGAIVSEGAYSLVAIGTNDCGSSDRRSTSLSVDLTPPTVSITSPTAGASIGAATDVRGQAFDSTFASYQLSYGAGTAPASWTTILNATHPVGGATTTGLLGLFQPPPVEGVHTLRLFARDRARNEAETRVVIEVAERSFLERFSVEPRVFSPNGDGRRDAAAIEYVLLAAARVTLEVRGPANEIVRQFEAAVDRPPGTYTTAWDGRTDAGLPAPDGSYQVRVAVQDPQGPTFQEASLALEVDRTNPTIAIVTPAAASDVKPDVLVHGSIHDLTLTEYVIEAVRPFAPPVELARGNESVLDRDLAELLGVTDGPYELVVRAEDAGANISVVRVPFTLDSMAPEALVQIPLPGAVLARGSEPIAITGTAADARLDRWELSAGPGAQPAYFVPVASGSEGGTGIGLGSWSVSSLPDGTYTLQLVVRDRAGHASEARAIVVLDSVLPQASFAAPVEGAYLRAPDSVDGTAADVNIEDWRLEASPGDAATAFQWSLLHTGTSSVTTGPLGDWNPLPPDGVHTLRLTVRDRAGHLSTALRTVTIDTVPPAPPSGLAGVSVPIDTANADVQLTWNASVSADVSGYRVARAGGAVLAELLEDTSYLDSALIEGTYSYQVQAVDRAGNESAPVQTTVRVDLTPPIVNILVPTAGARVGATVDVRGTAFSPGDFVEYRLLAGAGAAPTSWELVRRSTLQVSAGLLGTWTPTMEGSYVLALEAEDDSGNQGRVVVAVIADHSPPPAPDLLAPIDSGPADTLTPKWTPPPAESVAGYLVYRNGQLANAPGIVIGDLRAFLVPGPSYADTHLPDGEHCYRVVAMDEAGNVSVPSNTVCRSLDNRRPQATIVEPPAGTRFEFPLHLLAHTPDLDVTSVEFELKPSAGGDWQLIGAADPSAPYQQTLDPLGLAPGPYLLRGVAFDHSGPNEEDPIAIEVIYGDATAPAPPTNLVGWSDGGEVALSWSASPESDLDGYHVYRDGERLTAAPQAGTTFDDSREAGTYEYAVTAIDADANESLPATVEVTLYRPALSPLIPPTTDGPTATLHGSGAQGDGTIEIVRDGAVVAQAPSASGAFALPAVPVAPGPSVLVARERNAAGHLSLSSQEVVVIGNVPPPPVANLAATLDDHDVHLSWDAQAGIFGYRVTRDGTDITGTMTPVVSSATASDWLPGYDPDSAIDGSLDSLWLPTNAAPSTWAVEFPQPVLVARVSLAFAGPQGPVAAPAHRMAVEWNGRLLPLLDATASANSSVDYTLTLPFATTRLQIALIPTSFVGLAEVGVTALTVVSPTTPGMTDTAPDGVRLYGVTAIDGFGSRGPVSSLEVPVGDVEAPPTPTGLVATVIASDVALSWDPVAVPDLAAYAVHRDGLPVATVSAPSFVDVGRPNGTYSYTVRARDVVGNESADCAPETAVVLVSPPAAPVLSASAPPDGGVLLSWTHAEGAPHFVVARALVAGGPYTSVARTGAVTTFFDGGAQPGLRAFYVVSAEDSAGNLSAPSNEASAVPLLPRPVLLRPTDAAHPLEFAGNQTAVEGRAFPDALVALTVNGELRGATLAGRSYEPIEIASLPPNAQVVTVSPNGRLVGFIVEDLATGSVRSEWRDLLTGAAGTLPPHAIFHAFSPDERHVAYAVVTCGDDECAFDLDVQDLGTGAISVVEDGSRNVSESAWAPSGEALAIVSSEPGAAATRLDVVDLVNGLTRTIAQWGDAQYGIRWSPAGADIAVLRFDPGTFQQELVVHPSAGGSPLVAAEPSGNDVPEWERSGRRIAYQNLALSLQSWDLDTGTVAPIAGDASQPRFSRTGRYLSYFRSRPPVTGDAWLNRVVVRDTTSGLEHEVPTGTSQGGPSAPYAHQWLSGDFMMLASRQRMDLVVPFDGAFRVPAVALDPGPNVVEAEAIDVQAGAISEPSDPVTITTSLAAYPDLTVTASDLASYPTVPLAGQPIALSARVHNRGLAAVADVSVRLELRGATGVLIGQTVTISAIPAGGTAVASAYGSAGASGTYLFRVEADADQSISESNEGNNTAETGLHVTAAADLSVAVTTDASTYPAHTTAVVRVVLANGGAPWTGQVRTDVVAADGTPVASVDARTLSIGYGQAATIDLQWNAGVTLAGAYAFRARALDGDEVRASGEAVFTIEPHVAAWARVTPVDPTIPLGSAAQLSARIENRGANTFLDGLRARLRVEPSGGGAIVHETMAPLPTLPPGGSWEGPFVWSPATPAGAYVVRLDVLAASGPPLATADAALEVQSAAGLSGALTLEPAHVLAGAPVSALATVTNLGPEPLAGHTFAVEVRSVTAVIVSVPFTLDIPAGATRTATVPLPTVAVPFGAHPAFLRAAGAPASLDRETLHVHAAMVPPSIDTPPDGATVATAHPTLRVNNASSASGVPLSYAFELYRDAALTQQVPGATGVPETPTRTSWTVAAQLTENERYWWRARATDGFANSPWTSVASFFVDAENSAPSAPRAESPRDGETIATLQPELAVVNAFDPDQESLTYDFRVARDAAMLDVVASVSGVPETWMFTRWTAPAPLDEDVSYYWSARAHDPQQASGWFEPVRFLVDTTNLPPSAVPLLRPDDGEEVAALSTALAVGAAEDPEGDPLTYRFEIDRVPTFDSGDRQASPEIPLSGREAVWTPPLPLADNAYAYWRAAARDTHSSGPWTSRRFFVNLANEAPGVPVPLEPGADTVVTTQTPTLRVQNALDPDLDLLTFEFEVYAAGGGLVASVAGVPQGVSQSLWTVPEPLAENGLFTWRARAHDGALSGPWTADVPFRVNAVDEPPTAPVLVAPAEGAVLLVPPPALVVANATSPDLLELTYDFELYAVQGGGSLVLVESATGVPAGPTETAWSPTANITDGGYSWRARALDLHQAGPWMDSAHFTVAADLLPAPPTGLTALPGDTTVALSWNPNTEPDLTGYRVYRGTSSGGPYTFVSTTVQATYTDDGLVNGQTVYYVVTATDATQESPRSTEASATPRSGPVSVEVAYWPAAVEGECLKCPGTPSPEVPHFGPLRPVLECIVEEAGADTTTAYFGFDNGTASVTAVPVGPANFFTPAPQDRGQPEVFERGRSMEFPGVFGVPFTSAQITWTLGAHSATAIFDDVKKFCALPPVTCRPWLYATLEPPVGHDPAFIEVATVVLGGLLTADPTYQAIVDRDGDQRPELEVRFEQSALWPRLQPGSNAFAVTAKMGLLDLVGSAFVEVGELKARADFTPAIYSTTSRHPRVELVLRGCYSSSAIDIASIRFNGVVPVRQVISSTPERTIVEFDRDATIAVMPLGNRVEIVVTGLAHGQPFRAVDYIKVQP